MYWLQNLHAFITTIHDPSSQLYVTCTTKHTALDPSYHQLDIYMVVAPSTSTMRPWVNFNLETNFQHLQIPSSKQLPIWFLASEAQRNVVRHVTRCASPLRPNGLAVYPFYPRYFTSKSYIFSVKLIPTSHTHTHTHTIELLHHGPIRDEMLWFRRDC